MSEKTSVLYVDDEENNLIAFKAFFRKKYDVFTALSALDATQILESNEVDIIISDQRMPNTTGIEFLEGTIKKHPESIRLLITGQTDIETVIEAINRGQISQYLKKPWDWDKFKLILENCSYIVENKRLIAQKNEQLQKTNDELNRFVYSASHDLRSPLMSILGVVQLASLEPEMKVAVEYFKIIETSVLKLDQYIKSIIEYYQNSRAEELSAEINFNELITGIVNAHKNQDPKVKFEINVKQDGTFISDDFRLSVILNNLVSNAIKYQNAAAPEQCVTIDVIADSKQASITISDNGIGIQSEHFESIFKLFFRTPDANKKQGTGIGLYIVKEALEKIGGEISLNSELGKGSTFCVKIKNKLI
jgi:signal transduction histidine kinase